ncbi:ABC transporter B family member 27-like [Oopsacas minuta]|uniref:ABC transporter B family member 27-like n=1 Tax=Oopsacas minuta TaxID=111878 RepID=A0AAV7JXS1_9METZ|nr:ABC transporter B family member 27-like [Oopsacas minuta]
MHRDSKINLLQDRRVSSIQGELKMKSRVSSLKSETGCEEKEGHRKSYVQEEITAGDQEKNLLLFSKELSKYLNIPQDAKNSDLNLRSSEAEGGSGSLENREKEIFITHLRKINPGLFFGNIFVDGLFHLVNEEVAFKFMGVKKPTLDLTNIISCCTNKSVLEYFWATPDYEEDYNTYKFVSSSFMNYFYSIKGKTGLTRFFRKLNFSPDGVSKFSHKDKSLIDLEISWKKFAQAGISAEYNYSLYKFIWRLFRYNLIQHYFILFVIICQALLEVVTISYTQHLKSLIIDGLKTSSFLVREINITFFGNSSTFPEQQLLVDSTIIETFTDGGMLIAINTALVLILPVAGIFEGLLGMLVGKKLRMAIQKRILELTVPEYNTVSTTFVIVAFKQDVNNIEYVVVNTLGMFARFLGFLSIAYINGFIVHFSYPIYFTISAIVMNLIMAYFSHLSKKALFKNSLIQGQIKELLVENYEGLSTIQCYNIQSYWMERYDRLVTITKQFKHKWQELFFTNMIRSFYRSLAGINTVLSYYMFGILTIYVDIGFDEVYRTYILFIMVILRISHIMNDMHSVYTAALSLGRLDSLKLGLNKKETAKEKEDQNITVIENTIVFPRSKSGCSICSMQSTGSIDASMVPTPNIVLKNVSLTFSMTAAYWSAYNINMLIPYRSRIALVGQSGSGKTTLLNIITGMMCPTQGIILVNDKPLAEYHSLHKLYGVVHQFSHIFNLSIMDNIKLSRSSATDIEVIEVAKKCVIHDWVMKLPRKYDTIIEKGAKNISGGQLQRLAIARMLLYKPKVIVVDECTSHLDHNTAKQINNTLFKFTRGRTLIYSTNILERMEDFDRIYVIEHGAIRESGNHGELLSKRDSAYSRLYGKFEMARMEPNYLS